VEPLNNIQVKLVQICVTACFHTNMSFIIVEICHLFNESYNFVESMADSYNSVQTTEDPAVSVENTFHFLKGTILETKDEVLYIIIATNTYL
jgi:hypothetical protein